MQQIGSPILEMLVMQGIRPRVGLFRTMREAWRGFREAGVGGGLVRFVSAIAGITPNGLGMALAEFRADPATDPVLRDILQELQSRDVAAVVGDATIKELSAKTGLSRGAVIAKLSQSLPTVAGPAGPRNT